jgi:hypothetical protein
MANWILCIWPIGQSAQCIWPDGDLLWHIAHLIGGLPRHMALDGKCAVAYWPSWQSAQCIWPDGRSASAYGA